MQQTKTATRSRNGVQTLYKLRQPASLDARIQANLEYGCHPEANTGSGIPSGMIPNPRALRAAQVPAEKKTPRAPFDYKNNRMLQKIVILR